MCVCVYVCVCMRVCVCVSVCMYVSVSVFMCVHIWGFVYVPVSLQLPGAWTTIDGQKVTLYGSRFIDNRLEVKGQEVEVTGLSRPAVVTQDGLVCYGSDDKKVLITQLQFEDGKMIPASKFGKEEETVTVELTPEEEELREKIRVRSTSWS